MSSSRELNLLQDTELVSLLKQTDLVKFSVKLFKCRVISKEVNYIFASLDHAQLDSGLRVRYLLNRVYEEVKDDATAFNKFLKVLAGLGGHADQVLQRLTKELHKSERGEGGDNDEPGSSEAEAAEICLSEDDIPALMEDLVKVSDMWEEIGIALGLPGHVRSDCKERRNAISLTNVLSEWIKRNHHPGKTTLKNLKLALEGEVVGRSHVAQTILEKLTKTRQSVPVIPAAERPHLDSTLEIADQTTSAEVADGKSTLLEVEVNLPSHLLSYQWMKDGHSLSDDSPYSGAHTDILVIHPASQGTQGEYTCCISNGSQEVRSEKVVLTISFLPEKKRLINLYSRLREVPPDSWPPEGADTFINMALIRKKARGKDDYDYSVRGNMDDIIASKEKVEYQDVFGKFESGALVLLEGRPGSGKTTLVHKVTKDWATRTDVLTNAKMVYLVPLRCLAEGMDESLSNVFELFYQSKEQCEKISSDIERSDGEGVCFIVDGLDEYQRQDKRKSVIYSLIHMTCLPRAMVIVASRPVATATFRRQAPVTKRVEVLGFSQDQIFEYIDRFPFSAAISDLRAHLDLHRNVLHMCYLPVHAAMICYLYEDEQGSIPRTETEIYANFTRYIILRKLRLDDEYSQLDSLEELSGQDKKYFIKVCHLAFDMTIHSKQVVRQRDTPVPLSRKPGPNDAPSLGLVTIDNTAVRYGLDGIYTFLHLTFQEYLAAFHVATLDEPQQMEIITMYAGEEHMQVVWKFYCGMVTFEDKEDQLIKIMKSKEEYEDPLYRVQCAFESQQAVVCDYALEVETGALNIYDSTLTPADVTAVAYVISNTTHRVTKLAMNQCDLYDDHVRVLLRELSINKLKSMQRLDLSNNKLSSDGAAALAEGLKSCTSLQTLHLSYNNICSDGAAGLAEGLKSCTSLQILHLNDNNICSEGAAALAEGLKYCTSLQTLDLSYNNICSDGAAGLAEGLKFCTSLQTLVLSDNNICSDGAACLAEGLKSCTSLQTLNVIDNNICSDGATCLAKGLKSCTSLQTLDFSYNNICSDGAAGLAEGLKSCTGLRTLYLNDNNICSDGTAGLAEILKSCTSLQKLDLRNNNISDKGATALAVLKTRITSCLY